MQLLFYSCIVLFNQNYRREQPLQGRSGAVGIDGSRAVARNVVLCGRLADRCCTLTAICFSSDEVVQVDYRRSV